MQGGFRRSSTFGIVGVIVVMAACAVIGLQFGSGAHPTGALIAILAIVFGFIALMMVLQHRDLDRVEKSARLEVLTDPGPVADPTTVPPGELIASLAVRPVDEKALAGTDAAYGLARHSMNSGAVMVVLIFFCVVPWILFQWIWSIVIVGPIIGLYLLYLVARIFMPGGTVAKGFEASAQMLSPLGLDMTQHPQVGLQPRFGQAGYNSKLVGTLLMEGERHGRRVSVRRDGEGPTVTSVGGGFPEFQVKADGDRLRASRGAPAEIGRALGSLGDSKRWKGVKVAGGPEGIAVQRRRDSGFDWLCDLWLAERLADAVRA